MKLTKFQFITYSLFVIFIIAGVTAFALYRGPNVDNAVPPITIWGTYSKQSFDQYLAKVNLKLNQPFSVTYVQEPEQTFLSKYTAALARGDGPDGVLIPADFLLSARDKLQAIPYEVFPSRDFANMFIDEGRVYLSGTGILGLPFSVDPLVMYWNRDLFNTAGVALPPSTWDELAGINSKLTLKDDNGTISRSAVALGDFANVVNAREILGALFLQLGNPVTREQAAGYVRSTLQPTGSSNPIPAINFFTQFVNPNDRSYSWNRSWPDSRTAFVSGKLGIYFGFASELFQLRNKNPYLNFDVTALPQNKGAEILATYGKMHGFSISKNTQKANAAFQVMYTLTMPENLVMLSEDTYLPSVSRSVIASGSTDPYITTFNEQALISRTWLDVNPSRSSSLLGQMIGSITSGQKAPYQALSEFNNQYDALLTDAGN